MPDTSQYHGKTMEKFVPKAKGALRHVLGLMRRTEDGPVGLAFAKGGIVAIHDFVVFDVHSVKNWQLTLGDQGVILAFRGCILYLASIGLPIGDDDWTNITHEEYQKYLFSGRTVYFNPLRYQFVPMPPISVSDAHILLESTDREQKPERGEDDNLSELGSANVLLESTDESDNLSELGESNNSFALDETIRALLMNLTNHMPRMHFPLRLRIRIASWGATLR